MTWVSARLVVSDLDVAWVTGCGATCGKHIASPVPSSATMWANVSGTPSPSLSVAMKTSSSKSSKPSLWVIRATIVAVCPATARQKTSASALKASYPEIGHP
jgi:hypothetical protein